MKTIRVSNLPITVIKGYVENESIPILRFVIDGEVIYMKNHRLASPTTIQGQEIHWLVAWIIIALNTIKYHWEELNGRIHRGY